MSNSMFDDFVLKAKDVADAATKKTGELYELSKYKYECVKINGEIKHLYERLGKAVYSMVKDDYDNNELVESLSQEIDDLKEKLEDVKTIIAAMKHEIVCPACGANNSEENVYCSKCGSRLRSQFTPKQENEEQN